MGEGAMHPPPPLKTPSPDLFLPSPSSPSGSINNNNLPMPASHCMPPPPCSASGCASRGRMAPTLVSSLLGLVPSELEMEKAIRALLDLCQKAPSSGLEMLLFGSRGPSILMSSGRGKGLQALLLPVIKRLVISIALDKALGSAIMNNPSVQELLLSGKSSPAVAVCFADEAKSPQISEEEMGWGTNNTRRLLDILKDKILDLVKNFKLLSWLKFKLLSWLLDILIDKILDLVEKFKLLLIETFQPPQPAKQEAMADLDEKVGSSLLLSVLIILVVALAGVCIA